MDDRRSLNNQTHQPTTAEQSFTQQNLNGRKIGSRGSFVIAVANQKGGVAKTTTVVSLGGALVRHEQDVLLIDLDAQANLTLALGIDPSRMRGAITDVLFDSANLLSVSRETSVSGLDLVPSNSGMDVAERFLPVRKDYETILRRALDEPLKSRKSILSPFSSPSMDFEPSNPSEGFHSRRFNNPSDSISYNFVIIDCPPFMGAVTLNALVAADLLIIPTQPEYFSAHALRTMMGTIRNVRSQHNPNLLYRILITMLDIRNRIHRDVSEQICETFGEGVFDTQIGVDTKLRESAVEGLPITHHLLRTRSAQQYDALAQELLQYVG